MPDPVSPHLTPPRPGRKRRWLLIAALFIGLVFILWIGLLARDGLAVRADILALQDYAAALPQPLRPAVEASYQIDDGASNQMTVEAGTPWSTASATWDTGAFAQGFYTITLSANDGVETFTREVSIKVSQNQTVPIGELLQHFETYQGWSVTIAGTALVAMFGPPMAEEGAGGMKVSDATGTVVVYTGECLSPPLPA